MVRFKNERQSYGDETIPLEYLLGDSYQGYFLTEPKLRQPLPTDQHLLAALNRRERGNIAARVLLSKKDAEDVLKRVVIRSRAKERAKRQGAEEAIKATSEQAAISTDSQRKRFLHVLSNQVEMEATSPSDALRGWRALRRVKDEAAARKSGTYYYSSVPRGRRSKQGNEGVRPRMTLSRRLVHVRTMREERRQAAEAIEARKVHHREAARARSRGQKEASFLTKDIKSHIFGNLRQKDPMATAQLVRAVLKHGGLLLPPSPLPEDLPVHQQAHHHHHHQGWALPSSQTFSFENPSRLDSGGANIMDAEAAPSTVSGGRRRAPGGGERFLGGGFKVVVPNAVILQQFEYDRHRSAPTAFDNSVNSSCSASSATLPPVDSSTISGGDTSIFLRLVGSTALLSPSSRTSHSQQRLAQHKRGSSSISSRSSQGGDVAGPMRSASASSYIPVSTPLPPVTIDTSTRQD